jgi:hypothetical protein
MPATNKKTDEKMRQRGTVPGFYTFFLLPTLLVLAVSAAMARDVFRWGIVTPTGIDKQSSSGQTLKVTHERALTVQFSFIVNENVTKVRFALSRSDGEEGVSLLEEEVGAKDNVATSRLLLNIHRGVPLGRHDLYIQAFDAIKNVKIQTGKIPYILLPGDTECLCQMVPIKNKSKNTTQGGSEHA